MKKMLLLSLTLVAATTTTLKPNEPQSSDKQKTLALIVSFHNNAFGVDHLFDQPIEIKKLIAWLKVGSAVKQYILSNSTDIFGSQDSFLMSAVQEVENANNDLVDAIIVTYATKDYTDFLIKQAKEFQTIESTMTQLIQQLKNTNYVYQNKKNAQSLLISWALFIEATAKKAQKDTRMGHRTDLMPKTMDQQQTPPPAPVTPPPAQPTVYEEEPTETPPTRRPPAPPVIPGPPADMPPTIEELAALKTQRRSLPAVPQQ